MIHYTCDRCKKILDPASDLRYVIRIEAAAMMEGPDVSELDEDRDHLNEVNETLENLRMDEEDLAAEEAICEELASKRQYDLCCDCYRKFSRNPLGVEFSTQFDFSEN